MKHSALVPFLAFPLVLGLVVACNGGGDGGSTPSTGSDSGSSDAVTDDSPMDETTPPVTGKGGAVDPSFQPSIGNVQCIAIQPDGKVVFSGGFIGLNTHRTANIARVNADGTIDTTFASSNTVTSTITGACAVLPDGKILAGGNFSGPGGNRLVRLGADGVKDATFNVGGTTSDGAVSIVLRQPDGKVLVGGYMSRYNDASIPRRLLRIQADGTLDTTFGGAGAGPLVGPFVSDLALQPDGKILVAGSFETFDGAERSGIARVNADGKVDSSFTPKGVATGQIVHAVAVQPDGKILIGGNFTKFNATSSSYLVRLNADGSHDTSFNSAVATVEGQIDAVSALAVRSDGKIYVGGNFVTNDASHVDFVRLNSDGSLDKSFTYVIEKKPGTIRASKPVRAIALQSDNKIVIGGNGFLERILP